MSNNYFEGFDCTTTIRDYEFTRRAVHEMNRVLDSTKFDDMTGEEIFKYLAEEMSIVVFGDFLKRYLYEIAELEGPFLEVPDEVYMDILKFSFKENRVPFSFEETSIKPGAMVKRLLTQSTTSRNMVFLLGFALKMPDTDVEDFLKKVLFEESFNFGNPRECIFWYCFRNNLTFAKAKQLLDAYEELDENADFNERLWNSMYNSPNMYILSEESLMKYLHQLKLFNVDNNPEDIAFNEFKNLYDRVCEIVARQDDLDEVSPADVENEICAGIPKTDSGNMMKISASLLSKQFEQRRMTRQRIHSILNRKKAVERFDLVTLMFYIYADEIEPDWAEERKIKFIDEVNEVLNKCGMMDIYPVNPYEAFVLMCLVSEYPLDTYSSVWEQSYGVEW